MKQLVYDHIPLGFEQSATIIDGQLHILKDDAADHSEAIFCAQWDMASPFVEVLKGDLTMPKLAMLGWPSEDRAAFEARAAKDVPAEIDPAAQQEPL